MRKTMLVLVAVMAMAAMIAAPAFANFYENFDSLNSGELVGQNGWTGTAGIVSVDGGSAKVVYNDAKKPVTTGDGYVHQNGLNIEAEVVYFSMDMYVGSTVGDNIIDVRLDDATGKNFARWYGSDESERPRIGDAGIVGTTTWFLTPEQRGMWHHMAVAIDTGAGTSAFTMDGVSVGTLSYATGSPGISGIVSSLRIGLQNAAADKNNQYKWYDNVWIGDTQNPPVTPEPSSFMALGMFGLGALGFIKRRR